MNPKDEREKCTMCCNYADLMLHGKPLCYNCYNFLEQLKEKLDQNHTRWF